MTVKIQEIGIDEMSLYADISIAFEVESILKVEGIDNGLSGFKFVEKGVLKPYTKDYDSYDSEEARENLRSRCLPP